VGLILFFNIEPSLAILVESRTEVPMAMRFCMISRPEFLYSDVSAPSGPLGAVEALGAGPEVCLLPWRGLSPSSRVSLFRYFSISASKHTEAKRFLFHFIFACFCETNKKFFRFISHRFALNFFAISLKPFQIKTKNSLFFVILVRFLASDHFFAISLQFFCFKALISLFCFDFFCFKILF
jgi:hypothetical protein